MRKIGELSSRFRYGFLVVWGLIAALGISLASFGVTGENLFARLTAGGISVSGDASEAADLIAGDNFSESVDLLIHNLDESKLESSAVIDELNSATEELTQLSDELTVVNPLVLGTIAAAKTVPALASMIAEDGRGILFRVYLSDKSEEKVEQLYDQVLEVLKVTEDKLATEFPDALVTVGAIPEIVTSLNHLAEKDIVTGEIISLPIALLVLILVFGGFLAAGLPVIGALAAIAVSLGVIFAFSYTMDIDTFVVNVVTVIGLGLSIDYGLLIVSRFREEYRKLLDTGSATPQRELLTTALGRTITTAGKTVLFSGIIFAISAGSLLIFEAKMFKAIGVGALTAVVLAILVAVTLVPAVLAVIGPKLVRPGLLDKIPGLNRISKQLGDVSPKEGMFSKLGRWVQRHATIVTVLGLGALLLIGSQVLGLKVSSSFLDSLPKSSEQYPYLNTLKTQFPNEAPTRVFILSEADKSNHDQWASEVAKLGDVVEVSEASETESGHWISKVVVNPGTGEQLVQDIRAEAPSEFQNWVGGIDATSVDFNQALVDSAPWVAALIAIATLIVIFLMTGSLIIPLKALIIGALSLTASLGVLVWGFEYSNLAWLLNFEPGSVTGIETMVLILSLTFGFGLAVDYEMFLLSRIKEAKDHGKTNKEAVIIGMQSSGRIITSAALVIIVVFIGFSFGDLMQMKQLGVALAVTVFLDATLVRMLLVPAAMTLLGEAQWWTPKILKPLYAKFKIEE